jgi:hypothetical protein
MRIIIDIKTGNDAFKHGNFENELERIMGEVTTLVVEGTREAKVMDINGNAVGQLMVVGGRY